MQINRFTEMVIFVTSLGSTFFSCIALFLFFHFAFRFLVLLYSLECAGGFRSCGSDHGLCPLDSHKPLKRLDRNFYMDTLLLLFGLSGFVPYCRRGYFLWVRTFLGAPNKKINDTLLLPQNSLFRRKCQVRCLL